MTLNHLLPPLLLVCLETITQFPSYSFYNTVFFFFFLIWTSPFFQWVWTGEIYWLVHGFIRTQMLSNFFTSSLFDICELLHMCSGRMSQHRCSSQKVLGQIPWVNCSHEGHIEFLLDYWTRSQVTWRWFLILLMTPFLIKAQTCCAFVFFGKGHISLCLLEEIEVYKGLWTHLRKTNINIKFYYP